MILALVIVALFAYWLYLQFQSGSTISIMGFAVPSWMVYGFVGAIVIALIIRFLKAVPPVQVPAVRLRGAASGFVALIMIILSVIVIATYLLGFFGLSWQVIVSYSALALAILVLLTLGFGKKRGLMGIGTLLFLVAIAAVGVAVYYAHATNNMTYALYAVAGALAISLILFIMHRHGKKEEVVVLESS
jgi:hypothetical protein